METPRRIGSDAEDRAADFLLSLGYTLVGRRVKTRYGELDLVALDGETLVFVEVRMRRHFSPEATLDGAKYERLCMAAEEYAINMDAGRRARRLDVIAIEASELRHHKDAWS